MGRSMSRRVDVEPAQAASAILHEEVESKAAVAKNDPDAWAEIDDLLRNSPPEVEDPYKRTMYTALQLAAAKGGHHEIVKQLIRYYSGPSSIESFVNHKSHYSKSQSGDEGSQKALLNDSKSRYIVYVRRLLSFQCKQRKAETNAHRTALHYASAGGHLETVTQIDFKDRQWLYIRVIDLFRGSNNMCFFLALITLILAIQVPISRRRTRVHVYVEEEVEHLRTRSVLVSFCLTLSTFCAGVAFVTGGLAKVPVSESRWSLVLSRWVRTEWKLVFESTMLTTNLSMGFVLFIILMYTVCMDYFYILRY